MSSKFFVHPETVDVVVDTTRELMKCGEYHWTEAIQQAKAMTHNVAKGWTAEWKRQHITTPYRPFPRSTDQDGQLNLPF